MGGGFSPFSQGTRREGGGTLSPFHTSHFTTFHFISSFHFTALQVPPVRGSVRAQRARGVRERDVWNFWRSLTSRSLSLGVPALRANLTFLWVPPSATPRNAQIAASLQREMKSDMTAEAFVEQHGPDLLQWLQTNTVECACTTPFGPDENLRRGTIDLTTSISCRRCYVPLGLHDVRLPRGDPNPNPGHVGRMRAVCCRAARVAR
jgi:hypothetical protein